MEVVQVKRAQYASIPLNSIKNSVHYLSAAKTFKFSGSEGIFADLCFGSKTDKIGKRHAKPIKTLYSAEV
jgi:hypothetical protein